MSRRTAKASKAVELAWAKEQQLVREGKGTRDWTPEQQKDIDEKGKAYDDTGRAFEGQHMKSVEEYPDYQGDPDNIQFLTREEHLEAHRGDWKNPTNWYYNPVTKEMTDFGAGKYIPCEIIELSDPVIKNIIPEQEIDVEETENEYEANETHAPPIDEIGIEEATANGITIVDRVKDSIEKARTGLGYVFKKGVGYLAKHPRLLIVGAVAFGLGKVAVERNTSNDSGSGDSSTEINYKNMLDDDDDMDYGSDYDTEIEEEEDEDGVGFASLLKPQTKSPHDTRAYTRTRFGKVEQVRGYSTGKNRSRIEDSEDDE